MPASNISMIKKLQRAINTKGEKLLYQTSQFYSEQQKAPVTCHHIKKAVLDKKTGKTKNKELFSTYSMIQAVLYLRDYWYKLNDMPIPTDNQQWNEIKEKNNIVF